MQLIFFGFTFSFLVVLILGFIILRKWFRKQADIHIFAERQLQVRAEEAEARSREDSTTWRKNRNMYMR